MYAAYCHYLTIQISALLVSNVIQVYISVTKLSRYDDRRMGGHDGMIAGARANMMA